jgi:hypothetical protein
MSIQQRSRSAITPVIHADWPHVASAIRFLAIAVPLIGFLFMVRPPLVLPSVSALALASAAIIALVAWCMSSDPNDTGISLWDVSGAYAFIGFAAGMLSEPQQVMELLSVPAEPPSQLGEGSSH